MALETIRTLVIPAQETQGNDYIIELSAQENLERSGTTPENEVKSVLATDNGIKDPTDPDNRREFRPTKLWREAFDLYEESQHSQRNAEEMINRKYMEAWRTYLEVPSSDADPEMRRVLAETKQILDETALEVVKTSKERNTEPASDYRRIINKSEDFIHVQLGPTERGGKRKGGDYGKSLERYRPCKLNVSARRWPLT